MVRSPKWKRDFIKHCRRKQVEDAKKSFWERIVDGQRESESIFNFKYGY